MLAIKENEKPQPQMLIADALRILAIAIPLSMMLGAVVASFITAWCLQP